MTPLWMEIIFALLALTVRYFHFMLLEILLEPRSKHPLYRVFGAVILTAVTYGSTFLAAPGACLVLNAALFFVVPFAFFRGRPAIKLLGTALWMAIYACSEVLCTAASNLLGWPIADMTFIDRFRAEFFSCLFSCISILLLRGGIRLVKSHLDVSTWRNLVLSIIATIFSSSFIILNCYALSSESAAVWLAKPLRTLNVIGMFLPFITLLVMISLIHRLNSSIQESQEAHFTEHLARSELKQHQLAIEKNDQYAQLRHDMKNHLLTLNILAQKGEYDRQHEYLASLNAALDDTKLRRYCGHALIDSVLESKQQRIDQANVQFSFSADFRVPQRLLSDLELCTLIANLLDNAIDACELIEFGERMVDLALYADENCFIIQVVNSCNDVQRALKHASTFTSSRGKYHGIGLKSVRHIVNRHQGELLIRRANEGERVSTSVYLPSPRP